MYLNNKSFRDKGKKKKEKKDFCSGAQEDENNNLPPISHPPNIIT
jgi:hypothetical protein